MNYSVFKSNIEKGLNANTDYQPRVLCHLIKNGKTTKKALSEMLCKNHLEMNKTYSFFMSCPVWKVLTNKDMIEKIGDSYKLTLKLDESQKREITVLCHRVKRAHN